MLNSIMHLLNLCEWTSDMLVNNLSSSSVAWTDCSDCSRLARWNTVIYSYLVVRFFWGFFVGGGVGGFQLLLIVNIWVMLWTVRDTWVWNFVCVRTYKCVHLGFYEHYKYSLLLQISNSYKAFIFFVWQILQTINCWQIIFLKISQWHTC